MGEYIIEEEKELERRAQGLLDDQVGKINADHNNAAAVTVIASV